MHMSFCTYCRQKVGWFSKAHESCVRSSREGCEKVSTAVWAAVVRGNQFSVVKPAIDEFVGQHKIPANELHSALIEGWTRAAEEVGTEQPIDDARLSSMGSFHREAGLSDQELVKHNGYLASTMSNILWHVMHGSPLDAGQPSQFNIKSDESRIMQFGSTIYLEDTQSTHYVGGYSGASMRLDSGLYYHIGGFRGTKITEQSLKELYYGYMLITTKNLYFGGDHLTFRIPHEHIIRLTSYSDGIGIFRDASHSRREVFRIFSGEGVETWHGYGWFLFNLMHFLHTCF